MQMVSAGTTVEFRILNQFPLFREVYGSNGVGTVQVTGLVRQRARLTTTDGSTYELSTGSRLAHLRSGSEFSYAIRSRDGTRVYRLMTSRRRMNDDRSPQLDSYHIVLDDVEYRFQQKTVGRRGFVILDGSQQVVLVSTDSATGIRVQHDVPAMLVLLLPWLDNQVRFP